MNLPADLGLNPSVPPMADVETASDDYAARFAGPTGSWMLEVQERIILERLRAWPVGTVLDVGGGHGQLAAPIARMGWAVTVLGSAPSCRRRIEGLIQEGRCTFVVANLLDIPFPAQSFDVAVCIRLLPHCECWPRLIEELCRVARRAVLVDYPTSQSLNALGPVFFRAKRRIEGNTRTWRSFRHDEIERAFRTQGYEVRFRTGQFFFPMALHRWWNLRSVSAALEGFAARMGLTARWGSPVILEAVRRTQAGH